jgi:hypothetical protein
MGSIYTSKLRSVSAVAAMAVASVFAGPGASAAGNLTITPSTWRVVQRDSGPVNYYSVMREADVPFIRAEYRPPLKTVVLGWQTPEADRQAIRKLRWTWRARSLPVGGDECQSGKGDSAAVVYVSWRRALRYYTLKYVWSSVGKKGSVCDQKRNPFVAQDTIIVASGGPLDTWRTHEIDLKAEFRKHFEGGDANADVPDFIGVGIMSDGDQTKSVSSADYGVFTVIR